MTLSSSPDHLKISPEIWGPTRRSFSPKRMKMPVKGASTFESFSKLPCEIRFEIWKLCMPGPRTVRLKLIRLEKGDSRQGPKYKCDIKAFARYQVPSLLHTKYEARQFVLKYYVAAIGDRLVHPVYFNFKTGTLYWDPAAFVQLGKTVKSVSPIHAKYVRRLVVSRSPNVYFVKRLLKPFASLEVVTIEPDHSPWFTSSTAQRRAQQLIGTWKRVYSSKPVPKFYQLRRRDRRETRTAKPICLNDYVWFWEHRASFSTLSEDLVFV